MTCKKKNKKIITHSESVYNKTNVQSNQYYITFIKTKFKNHTYNYQ